MIKVWYGMVWMVGSVLSLDFLVGSVKWFLLAHNKLDRRLAQSGQGKGPTDYRSFKRSIDFFEIKLPLGRASFNSPHCKH